MFNRLSSFVNKYKLIINITVLIILICCLIFPIIPINILYEDLCEDIGYKYTSKLTLVGAVCLFIAIRDQYLDIIDPSEYLEAIRFHLFFIGCMISLILVLLNIVLSIKGIKTSNLLALIIYFISLFILPKYQVIGFFTLRPTYNWIVILVLLCLMSIYYILWGIDKFKHRQPKTPKPKKPTQKERIEMLEKELAELKSKTN